MFLFLPRSAAKLSVTAVVRLKTATENPFDSMLRTRFSPITARPIRPISDCIVMPFRVGFRCLKNVSNSLNCYRQRMANYDCDVALEGAALDVAAEENTPGAGAIVQFFGDVRPLENGEHIDGIQYGAHREMAEHQLRKIADEAAERFGLLAVRLHHRVGFVAVGETSFFLRGGRWEERG